MYKEENLNLLGLVEVDRSIDQKRRFPFPLGGRYVTSGWVDWPFRLFVGVAWLVFRASKRKLGQETTFHSSHYVASREQV
jgi:hypothetical protein